MRLIRLLKNDIAREAAEWVEEDIISQSQAEAICRRYGADYVQQNSRSFGYHILIALGYLFIGLSLITLLGANWEDIPRAIRMWGLIGLTMTVQGLALRKYVTGNSAAAVGFFLLGNLVYGASIILIAQIYHLGEHMPDGVFWWALGCLPFAVLLKNPWLMLQCLLLAAIWFFLETSMDFYPVLFPMFIIAAIFVLYHGRQSILLFLAVIASIGFWVEYSLAALWREYYFFDVHAEHLVVSVALFIFAYTCSYWLQQRDSVKAKDYAALLAVWSLRFGLVFMLVMEFKGPWQELIRARWDHLASMSALMTILCGAALLIAYKTKKLMPTALIIPFYVISVLGLFLADGVTGHAIYFQVIYNIVVVCVGAWLVVRGIHKGISHYFFLGVTVIVLTALLRYIDLIGDYIGAAVLFLFFAMVLLAAAKFWKHHHSKVKPA